MSAETHDGTKVLGEISGLGAPEVRKLLDEVRANQKTLDACDAHDFEIPPPFTPGGRATCRRCGGWTSPTQAHWYDRGREHERAIR